VGLARAEIATPRQVGARKDKRERAGTSPAPTTLDTQFNNQVVAGAIPAWGVEEQVLRRRGLPSNGCIGTRNAKRSAGGDEPRPYGIEEM